MKSTTKFLLLLAFLSFLWTNYCYADLVITDTSQAPEDRNQGYIENASVNFSVTNGQSSKIAGKNTLTRSMRRVELEINDKKIVIQNSGDKELYVKGQDQSGGIVNLEDQDYASIQLALKNLADLRKGNTTSELHEAIGTALSLLASWPQSMPLLIWQDELQKISAIDNDTIISEAPKSKTATRQTPAKSINKSILQNPDTLLHFPEITPLVPQQLPALAPTTNAPGITPKAAGVPSSDSSISLCKNMGTAVAGTYPLISATLLPPFTKVDGWEKYTATVGGVQCLARCGGGCVDSVTGVNGFGKNAYSQDCLDHDVCVGKRGNSGYCNFIFSDAANDFFSTPCGHDLILQNVVVSNDTLATSQPPTISSKQNLYVIFTVKNNGNTRLPHNKIFFDISVDGKLKATRQLARVLNAFDSSRYFYQIGSPQSYPVGAHSVNIQIKSTTLIQTNTGNDAAKKPFNLQ